MKNLNTTTLDEITTNYEAEVEEFEITTPCPCCGENVTEGDIVEGFCPFCGGELHLEEAEIEAVGFEQEYDDSLPLIEKVRAYMNGNEDYFNDIFREGLRVAKKMIMKGQSNNVEALDEIAQDTMIKFFGSLEDFHNVDTFYGYLKQIAVRTKIDYFRSPRYTKSVQFAEISTDEMVGKDDNMKFEVEDGNIATRPEEGMKARNNEKEKEEIKKEIIDDMNSFIMENLNDKERTVFDLRLKGLKYKEIAEELNLPMSTVIGRVSMAKKKIEDYMESIYLDKDIKDLYDLSEQSELSSI